MMIGKATRTNFAGGEVSPTIRAANDLTRFQIGAEKVENLVVLVEAILTRRPGTRFVCELKNETQPGRMVPFRRTGSDYYMLAFNGGAMRILKDGGRLESSPGTPYELVVPWVAADMAHLRSAVAGNTLIQVCAGRPPQRITRIDHTNWSIEPFEARNGPVDTPNLNTGITIQASAVIGAVTLTGSGSPFDAGHVGGVFRLDEASQSIVPLWQANETIDLTTESVAGATGTIGDVTSAGNAFDGNPATSAQKTSATDAYVGRAVSPASTILNASVLMSGPTPSSGGTVTLRLYGSNAAPADGEDGVLLAELAYDVDLAGSNTHVLTSSEATTPFTHLWVRAEYSGSPTTIRFAEVVLTRLAAAAPPVLRRWQEHVYQALVGGNTGINAPMHTEGDVAAGTGNVTWRYLHSGYGFVRIDAVVGPNQATGTVLSRLPDSLLATPSYRFFPPAWGDAAGWPSQVATHDRRAYFARDDIYWLTRPNTIDDFEADATEESAIARRLLAPDGSAVVLEWALSSGVLVQGARDGEWLSRAPGNFDVITATTARDVPDQYEGSAPHVPALVDGGAVFIGRDRKRLHYVRFGRLVEELTIKEVSIASRHIFGVGAVALAWQKDPHRLLWALLTDGTLACLTFMPAENVTGMHRHPMPGCFVEDIASIPTADNGRSELLLQTRRTIAGQTRRYYELMMPFFEPQDAAAPTAEGAWFVDCGLRYEGAPVSRVSGLGHLIGEEVAVFADGAEQRRTVVDAEGGVDLDYEASDIVVGKPITWRFRDLPRDIQIQEGSSKSNPKRASHVVVDVRHAAGGMLHFNGSAGDPITETGALDYGAAIPLTTGPVPISIASATEDEGVLELIGDNALPFTLLALTPTLEIEDAP